VKPRCVFDIECVGDWFLVYFKQVDSGKKRYFEMYDGHPLDRQNVIRVLRNHTIIGFNSLNYDVPMLRAALRQGVTNKMLKQMNDAIIGRQLRHWQTEREFNLPKIDWLDHIDLIEPAPSVNVGLKLYGGRLHSKRIQDLPFDPDELMFNGTPGKREEAIIYCENDLDTTIDLYRHIAPQIELRESMSKQYGVDVRSKSDAQIAEAVIKSELERQGLSVYKPEFPSDYSFKYDPPSFLEYQTEQMQEVFDIVTSATFRLKKTRVKDDDESSDDPSDGSGGVKIKVSGVEMPAEIKKLRVKMGGSTYKMGIGGLHSTEKRISHYADDEYILKDADVASYYPAVILTCELYPEHLGYSFLSIYKKIRDERVAAKHRASAIKKEIAAIKGEDTLRARLAELETELIARETEASTKKVTTNGAFGKLGSKYSFLYSPKLMLQVTITGQLVLLMLIESLELAGISVISANTDGIVSRIHKNKVDLYHSIISDWEKRTGFEMEFAEYASLHSASVNSYIAIKPDGSVKQKGLYAFVGSKGSPAEKNPKNHICIDAVIAYLTKGTPLDETIEWCPDIRRFLSVQRVKGGAEFEGQYLGKVARWYRSSRSTSCIKYATGDKQGDKVSMSDNAMPMMELSGLPDDLDYPWYISQSRKMLGDLGVL